MAAESGRPPTDLSRRGAAAAAPANPVPAAGGELDAAREGAERLSVVERLFAEGHVFDFFQAVRLLERLLPSRQPVGRRGPAALESARFRALISLSFPPSAVHDIARPTRAFPIPTVTVTFLGLTGPAGVMPRHYTELLTNLHYRSKDPERHALRDWFDLFNHRLVSFFYRAWEKYRFYIPYEREEYAAEEPDPFSLALYGLVGLGTGKIRRRLRVAEWTSNQAERRLAEVDDLSLLFYGGLLSRTARSASGLEAVLADYFGLPVEVQQFQGQWLALEPHEQTRLGGHQGHNCVGEGAIAGSRVWNVQGKVRVRLGPVSYAQFVEFLPDRTPSPERKAYFLLRHLVRFYIGPELDLDVQLVLAPGQVPPCRLEGDGIGPRLGWNTWLASRPPDRVVDDVVLGQEEITWVNATERAAGLGISLAAG